MWIWIAVAMIAVLVLAAAVTSLLGRLSGLERALRRLTLRQEDALRIQRNVEVLEQTLLGLQQRAEVTQEHTAKHSLRRS